MSTGTYVAPAARWIRASSLLLVLLGVACGDDDGPFTDPDGFTPETDAGPPDDRTFLELCYQPELYCERLYACAEPERLASDQLLFGHEDEASCVEAQHAITGVLCHALESSLWAGRMTVDRPKLVACVDYVAELSCHEYVHADPTTHELCQGSPFLSPNVPLGGECTENAECIAPADLCTAIEDASGQCAVAPTVGEPCLSGLCAEGLQCLDEVCVVPTNTCANEFDCADDEWCDQPGNDFRVEYETPDVLGICTAKEALGETCEDLVGCIEGLYCDDTRGFDDDGFRRPGHCTEPRETGGACNEPADCVSLECSDAGTCA